MAFRINPSFVIAAGLAITATAWILSGQFGDQPSAADAPISDEREASIVETTPDRQRLPTVRVMQSTAQAHRAVLLYTGKTEAERSVILRAETDGRIIEVLADESDILEVGADILKIDVSDRPSRLREANALIRQREIEFDAAKSLAGKGFQTRSAQAEAEANLSAALAMREQIRVDLDRTTIRAPFSGVLETRSAEIGDYVRAGDEVARFGDYDPAIVTIQVSEREINRIEEGAAAEIELISGEVLPGFVKRLAATSDPVTRTFEVALELSNEDGLVRDGMTAKVLLPAQEVYAHQISPALLTLSDEGKVGVKALNSENIVEFHPIQIVEDRASAMWVSGLPRDVTLIVVGQAFVAPGITVDPVMIDKDVQPQDGSAPALSIGGEGTPSNAGDRS